LNISQEKEERRQTAARLFHQPRSWLIDEPWAAGQVSLASERFGGVAEGWCLHCVGKSQTEKLIVTLM